MEYHLLFVVKDKHNRDIRLTLDQWKHITYRHPEMARRMPQIEETIKDPTREVRFSDDVTKFYRFLKNERKYLMVAVKILNGEGFVITSYLTSKIGDENET